MVLDALSGLHVEGPNGPDTRNQLDFELLLDHASGGPANEARVDRRLDEHFYEGGLALIDALVPAFRIEISDVACPIPSVVVCFEPALNHGMEDISERELVLFLEDREAGHATEPPAARAVQVVDHLRRAGHHVVAVEQGWVFFHGPRSRGWERGG